MSTLSIAPTPWKHIAHRYGLGTRHLVVAANGHHVATCNSYPIGGTKEFNVAGKHGKLMAAAPALLDIAKRAAFLFATYEAGTLGARVRDDANALIKQVEA